MIHVHAQNNNLIRFLNKLTVILITNVNVVDEIWKLLNDYFGDIIVNTGGIQKTHMKDGLSHSSTLVDIPVHTSCPTPYVPKS